MAGFLPNDLVNITGAPTSTDVFITQQDGEGTVKKLTYAELTQTGLANGLCPLDADSKIPGTHIPSLAITNVYVVADITARDAITPIETGDTIKVSDSDGLGNPQTYIYDGTVFIDIQETSDVISVNGATGVVVLTTTNIASSTDKNYVTDIELINVQTIGTTDHNTLTDVQLASVNTIGTTDYNTLTDVQVTKLDALEGTDKRVLTDAQLVKVDKIESILAPTIFAGTLDIDMSSHSQFTIVATENFTLNNPTGLTPGQQGYIQINQDATGSRILTLDTNYLTVGGVGITLTITPSATDVIKFEVLSATAIVLTLLADLS